MVCGDDQCEFWRKNLKRTTNAVTTSVQNVQHVVNNSTQRIRDIFSEYDHAVIKGNYMSEDFQNKLTKKKISTVQNPLIFFLEFKV